MFARDNTVRNSKLFVPSHKVDISLLGLESYFVPAFGVVE